MSEKIDHTKEADDDNRELAHLHVLIALVEQVKRVADAIEESNHANCRHHNGYNCGGCKP